MENWTAKQIAQINGITTITKKVGLGTKIQEIITELNSNEDLIAGTPVNAVNAAKILTISGVVKDGETVTINNPAIALSDVYEFLADTAQSKTAPENIAVDITANTVKAFGTLTIDVIPVAGNTMTIGAKVYTFVALGTSIVDGEIALGTDLAATKPKIVAAINGTDTVNTPHPLVSAAAFVLDDCVITALIGGVAGNAIVTTETFTPETDIFAAGTLGSGADCTAANGVAALVAAITASDTQGVGAVDGDGDTVVLTADIAGVIGNAIGIGKVMANGAFAGGAVVLSGGVDGTVGALHETMIDSTYMYRTIAANTTAGKNWRRIALGSVY